MIIDGQREGTACGGVSKTRATSIIFVTSLETCNLVTWLRTG